jgi:hypothetical protein
MLKRLEGKTAPLNYQPPSIPIGLPSELSSLGF